VTGKRKTAKTKRRTLTLDDAGRVEKADIEALYPDSLIGDLCQIAGVVDTARPDFRESIIGVAWWFRVGNLPEALHASIPQVRDDLVALEAAVKKTSEQLEALCPEACNTLATAAETASKDSRTTPGLPFEGGDMLLKDAERRLAGLSSWIGGAIKSLKGKRVHPKKKNEYEAVAQLALVWQMFAEKKEISRYDPRSRLSGNTTTPFAEFVSKALSPVGVRRVTDAMIRQVGRPSGE
jgi:hypothetical protein